MYNPITLFKKIFYLNSELPREVDIEISTVCNLSCRMCKRQKVNFGDSFIPYEKFIEIMDKIPKEVEIISFGGYGEMLLHPQFNEMVKYAKAKGFFTATTSNGTLLNTDEKIISLFDSGLDYLRVSVDHMQKSNEKKGEEVGHVFSQELLKNLRRVSEVRKEKNKSIILGINTVVHHENIEEIVDIIRYAEDIGFNKVELIRLDTCLNHSQRTLHVNKERELYKKIEKMGKKIRVITPINRFQKWRTIFYAGKDFCHFRVQSAHIRINGQVTPCAFGFAIHNFGNIYKKELKEIWNGEDFKRIRMNEQNQVCKNCNITKAP